MSCAVCSRNAENHRLWKIKHFYIFGTAISRNTIGVSFTCLYIQSKQKKKKLHKFRILQNVLSKPLLLQNQTNINKNSLSTINLQKN